MHARKPRRERPPLDEPALQEMALRYVGRFATTRAKLLTYLGRKLKERGWKGDAPPDLDRIVGQFADRGYIDDAGYALAKSRALVGRGYGKARVVQSLRAAGVAEEDSSAARDHAAEEAVAAALRFAKRKRLGPFAPSAPDVRERERALAAMVRAGHSFQLSKAILATALGIEPDLQDFAGETFGRSD